MVTGKVETVAVTGAAGTVGGYIVRELVSRGYPVIAIDRPHSRWALDLPAGAKVETREGDLTDLAFCVDAVAGAPAVIHAAASIDLGQPWEEIKKINVDAVRYLYEAARARGCRRFVFFSSGSIYDKSQGGPIDESRPFAPQSPYERSKVEAERYLWSRPRTGPEVVVLRPTMIYGPRARFLGAKMATIPPILALWFTKIPRMIGGASCNWAHAEDVARAAVFVLEEPRAAWEAFNVADETPLTAGEVLEVITRAYGLPLGASFHFPRRLVGAIAPYIADSDLAVGALSRANERAWKLICEWHGLEPAISAVVDREGFLYATVEAIFDTTKLRALGWSAKWRSLREGYPEVLRWFQDAKWLPRYVEGQKREWGGGIGFQFAETMAGTWRQLDDGGSEKPFKFTVTARAPSSRQFARDGLLELSGTIDAAGLATARPCKGTLDISWVRKRELAYDLEFTGDDGRPYRFAGKKDVRLLRFRETMTTLPGRVYDHAGREVGAALARFDLRKDLASFLGSFDLVAMTAARPSGDRAATRVG